MKILIVGAGGQVGDKLAVLALGRFQKTYGTFKSRPATRKLDGVYPLDKTDEKQIREVFSKCKPDVVVDTGALHNVDYCETHPDEATSINVTGTKKLAEACRLANAKFIFVSTDFVFDGVGAPYDENARPNPISVYGTSKLEGEKLALAANKHDTAIVRPAVIYSWVSLSNTGTSSSSGKPLNFGAWFVSQLAAKKEVSIVNDQVTSPTLADDLANAILAIAVSSKNGIFHTAGATPLSRYDFCIKVAEKLGLQTHLVHPIPSSSLKQVARRPLNSSLLSNRIKEELGYSMMDIDKALDMFVSQARKEEAIRA